MKFKETLPPACPPNCASHEKCGPAFRLVRTAKPVEEDFLSEAAKGLPSPPNIEQCRWASCSLFTSLEVLRKKRKTFHKLKSYDFFIEISIPANSGRHIIQNCHIDFWMFAAFDPLMAITRVVPL